MEHVAVLDTSSRARRIGIGLPWLVVVLGSFVWAEPAEAQLRLRDLSRFESKAYVIHTNLTREEALEYGRHMDLIYREYARRFSDLRGGSRRKQNLYLFRTEEDYHSVLQTDFRIPSQNSGGMFFGTGLATWIEGSSQDWIYEVLQHEGFHQFAHDKLGDQLPIWVNEGLAEYFGAAIIVDGDVRLGIVDENRLALLRAAMERRQTLGFQELLNLSHANWNANLRSGAIQGHLQYIQAWSMVHFLVHGDRGRYRDAFGNYLIELSRGRSHEVAFRKSFGDNNAAFERRWERFIGELEADSYSLALKRIQFLAAGVLALHESDESEIPAPPADLAELRERLAAVRYRQTVRSESGERTTEATDESLYRYEDRRGRDHAFELIPAEKGSDLPPSLATPKLRPAVTLSWTRDGEGHLRPKIDYGR
ncbi:MAG: DUF1570 domain-containing protein [Planctomycetota bacterium]